MSKDYGQQSKKDVLYFLPEQVDMITNPADELFDPRALNPWRESMVLDIMDNEVIKPTVIAPPREKGGKPILVDGRQRYINLVECNRRRKEAGLDPYWLPCVWRKGDASTLLGVMVAANSHSTPVSVGQQAQLAQRLENGGKSVAQIAVRLNVTPQTVRNYLAIAASHESVRQGLEDGKLTVAMAAELARGPRDQQAEQVKKLEKAGLMGGSAGLKAAKAARSGKDVTKADAAVSFSSKRFLTRLEEELSKREVTVDGCELLNLILGKIEPKNLKDADIRFAVREALKPQKTKAEEAEEVGADV